VTVLYATKTIDYTAAREKKIGQMYKLPNPTVLVRPTRERGNERKTSVKEPKGV